MKHFGLAFIILFFGFQNTNSFAAKGDLKNVGTFYFVPFYGHLHQNPSNYSQSVTALSCGHPVKLMEELGVAPGEWNQVEASGRSGFIRSRYLSASRTSCFEQRFPEFVQKMELRIEDLYYWGKLYDNYTYAEVKLP